ncbi:MAG: hypothetical protein M9894_18500 [Planctomycetes bacterium]|nr:hypothetical protein [Planctomycetota bacterium]
MDERLRGLERQAAHDPEAAPRLLLERVRRGELPEERLELAGHLGHPAARQALGLGDEVHATLDLTVFLADLAPWGGVIVVRGLCAAGAEALPRFAAQAPDDGRPGAALAAAAAWADRPGPETALAARAAGRGAERAAQDLGQRADFHAEWAVDTPELYAGYHAAWVCAHAANAALVLERLRPTVSTPAQVEPVVDAFVRALERTGADEAQVRAAAEAALIAWALGPATPP